MMNLVRRAAVALAVLFYSAQAPAATFVPMSVENLTRASVAAVIGRVSGLRGVVTRGGAIFTLVDLDVDRVVFGSLEPGHLILKELGGSVHGRREVLYGTPSYYVGEHVFVFLSRNLDGSLRTSQLALGKFHLDPTLDNALQVFGPEIAVLGQRRIPTTQPLEVLRKRVSAAAATLPPSRPLRLRPHEADDPSLLTESTDAFTLMSPTGRLFAPDRQQSIDFLIDQRGDAILGLAAARQAVDDALDAWSLVPDAAIVLQDGGLTAELSSTCSLPHRVRFNDPPDADHPSGVIPPPVNCSGTLGLGGFCSSNAELKVIDGTHYRVAVRAMLTLADGWEDCAEWTPCNIAEVATHEIGHAIGLGHSSELDGEMDPLLADATMFFQAHFDGRCADVRQDDADGVRSLYPILPPPSILTRDPLPTAITGESYRVALAAGGGSGSYLWTLEDGGFPGLDLSANGILAGTPTAFGSGFFRVMVTDEFDDSHTMNLNLTVRLPPTMTPTGNTATPTATTTPHSSTRTPSSTPQPPTSTPTRQSSPTRTVTRTPTTARATATRTPTQTATMPCAGDCNGDGAVTVNELINAVNIALGKAGVDACSAVDGNGDASVTVSELIKAVNRALNGCT